MTAATIPARGGVASPRPNKCHCGKALRQETDGRGGVRDLCPVHGFNITDPRSPSPVEEHAKQCPVKGCPGYLDTRGACPCCEKRKAYELEHIKPQLCAICDGEIPRGRRARKKYCGACAPIVARVRFHKKDHEGDA